MKKRKNFWLVWILPSPPDAIPSKLFPNFIQDIAYSFKFSFVSCFGEQIKLSLSYLYYIRYPITYYNLGRFMFQIGG